MWTLPATTATDLMAYVTSILGDAGTLGVVLLAAGVPFGFYVISRLIGLVPKGRGRRQ